MENKLSIFNASELFTCDGKRGIIGSGAYGYVRLCKNIKSEKFAVKCFSTLNNQDKSSEKFKKIMTEGEILHKLSHQHIIKVLGITKWNSYIGIITEYLPGGNLDGFINNKKLENIPWCLRLRIVMQLSDAICYLHQYKIKKELIHGDIKPENILLDRDFTVKLADFGAVNMAIHAGATKTSTVLPTKKQHTMYYTAPEFLADVDKLPTTKMDVYSFGIVLYEIVTRSRPYENVQRHVHVIIQVIIDRGQRPNQSCLDEIQSSLSPDELTIFKLLVEQMKQCWSQDPNDRPDMQTVRDTLQEMYLEINAIKITEQTNSVLEKLEKEEKDFDATQGIPLNSISLDSGEITLKKSHSAKKTEVKSTKTSVPASPNMLTGASTSTSVINSRKSLQGKAVIIGNTSIGKTCMLITHISKEFPAEYSATIGCAFYNNTMLVDGQKINLTFWDTAGHYRYKSMREMTYSGANVLLLCISVVNPESYEDITKDWMPEVKGKCPNATILLIGTMIDLRDDTHTTSLTKVQGLQLAEEIGAFKYVECSALTREGLEDVFMEAGRAFLHSINFNPERKDENKEKCCCCSVQ